MVSMKKADSRGPPLAVTEMASAQAHFIHLPPTAAYLELVHLPVVQAVQPLQKWPWRESEHEAPYDHPLGDTWPCFRP